MGMQMTARGVVRALAAVLLPLVGTLTGGAYAADLGGNCCADLEERIAELEATTVRRGTRKVSMQVYGQVHTALLVWDDGISRDTYVVDNDFNSTRFGVKGTATIGAGWKAGYLVELETNHEGSDSVSQNNDEGTASSLDIRFTHWTLEHESYGRLTLGETSSVTDNLYKFGNIAGAFSDAELHYNGQFFIRSRTPGFTSTTLRWDTIANNLDTSRGDFARYDSPSLAGFVASAAWGEDDIWDVSLRYTGEFAGFKAAAAIGYVEDQEGTPAFFNEPRDLIASAGLHHLDSGLYLHAAAGRREIDGRPGFDDTAEYGYVQAGFEKKVVALGATTLYVDAGRYRDFGVGVAFDRNVTLPGAAATNNSTIFDSEVTRWGFGATQKIDAAALEIYGVFNWYEADVVATTVAGGPGPLVAVPTEDWWSLTAGSRLKF